MLLAGCADSSDNDAHFNDRASAPAVKADPAAATQGQWSAVADWPFIPIHAAVLPDGRVLTYGTTPDNQQGAHFEYDIWDPQLGLDIDSHLTLPNVTSVDTFCSAGLVMPQSGNLMSVSGDARGREPGTEPDDSNRNRDVLSFDYRSNTVRRLQRSINHQRWYGTMTMMPSGEVLMQGGTCWNGNELICDGGVVEAITPEIYRPGVGWELLTGASSDELFGRTNDAWWYPRSWVAPDGRVFGISHGKVMYYLDTSGTGDITTVGDLGWNNYGYTGSAVMYAPGKIMVAGGLNAASSDPKGSTDVRLIDINGATPQVSAGTPLAVGLQWPTTTVMADGQVLLTGGSERHNQLTNVQYAALIWNPETGQWQTGASASTPRLYHSSTLLLPDGRIFTGGGGAPGPLVNNNAEVYSPPYLFDANGELAQRPQIASAPQQVSWGDGVATITLAAETNVSRVTWVASGADTHSFDMNQRFIEPGFAQSAPDMLSVNVPTDPNQAPPGYYMVFVFDDAGVPSVAAMVRLLDTQQADSADLEEAPNLLANGSFELNAVPDGGQQQVRLSGWLNASGAIDVWRGAQGLLAGDGTSWIQVDANAGAADSLHQQVTTLAERDYQLSFVYSAPPGAAGTTTAVDVLWNDVVVAAINPDGQANTDNNWTVQSVVVRGTGFDRLTFREAGSDDGTGAFIDGVTLVQQNPGSNLAPELTQPADQQSLTGESVALQLQVSDPDGPLMQVRARDLPPGLSVSNTGLISGEPTQPGQYLVTVSVSDGDLSNVAQFAWLVDGDPSTVPAACNLLSDGSFDSGLGAWATNTSVTDGVTGFDNSPAVRFSNGWISNASQSVQGNTSYEISGWYQLAGSGWTGYGLNYFDAAGSHIGATEGSLGLSANWSQLSLTDTVPAGTAEIRLWIFAGDGMTLTLDAVVLRDTACTGDNGGGGNGSGGGGTANTAPYLVNPGDRTANQGEVTSLFLNGRDDDGDELTYTALGLPDGLTISTGGVVTGTPTVAGTFAVTATVSDGQLEHSTQFNWTVLGDPNVNNAPVLTNPGAQLNDEGDVVSLAIIASDTDGDPLTFSASGLPGGLTMNGSGVISGTANIAGQFLVTVTVSDGELSTEVSFDWAINAPGNPGNDLACNRFANGSFEDGYDGWNTNAFVSLVSDAHESFQAVRFGDGWMGTGTFDVQGGQAYTLSGWYKLTGSGWAGYGIDFFNADGLKIDAGSYTLTNTTDWQQFSEPAVAPAGTVEVRLWIFAGNGLTLTLDNVDLRAADCTGEQPPADNPPVLDLPQTQLLTQGDAVNLQLQANDPDGDALTFSATGLPPGLVISSAGLISGTADTLGSWTSTVTVTAAEQQVSGALQWTVEATVVENRAPVLVNPGAQAGTEGQAVSLALSASDPDGDGLTFSVTGLPGGLAMSTSGVITGTPDSAGTYEVVATVTDSALDDSQAFQWVVETDASGGDGGNAGGDAGAQCNLFDNPGFENGLTGWSANVTPQFVADAYEGASAARYTNGFVGHGTFDVQAGAAYTISGWYKLSGSGWTGYGVDYFNAAGTKIDAQSYSLSNSAAYQAFSETAVAPAGTVEIRFWIFAGNGMTLTLDGVSLVADGCSTGSGSGGGQSNSAPVMVSPGGQNSEQGSAVALSVQANDADNDPLSFTATGLPAGLQMSPSGDISGVAQAAGSYAVTLIVSDGQLTDSESILWEVAAPGNGGGGNSGGGACNLFANGGFESNADNWNTNAVPTMVSDAYAGNFAARFSDGWLGHVTYEAQGSTEFVISGWYKLAGSGWSGYGLDYFNASGTKLGAQNWTLANAATYSAFSESVMLPANTTEVRLWIAAGAGHTMTLDDVSLQRADCN